MISFNKTFKVMLLVVLVLVFISYTYSIVDTNNQLGPLLSLYEGIHFTILFITSTIIIITTIITTIYYYYYYYY